MVVPMPSGVLAKELFQMRLQLERDLLHASDLGDEQLRSRIDRLQAACGEKQLTQQVGVQVATWEHWQEN